MGSNHQQNGSVGQHTREIMREFGFTDDEIDALCAEKAVFETMSVND